MKGKGQGEEQWTRVRDKMKDKGSGKGIHKVKWMEKKGMEKGFLGVGGDEKRKSKDKDKGNGKREGNYNVKAKG